MNILKQEKLFRRVTTQRLYIFRNPALLTVKTTTFAACKKVHYGTKTFHTERNARFLSP